jgi:signal transduction histidine kinase
LKLNDLSVKWKVFFFILIFAAVMMVLLWLFQTVFLNDFYKTIKTQQIKTNAGPVEQNIDNPDLQMLLDQLSRNNDTSIVIADMDGNIVYETDSSAGSVHIRSQNASPELVEALRKNGGTLAVPFTENEMLMRSLEYQRSNFQGSDLPPGGPMRPMQGIMLTRLITNDAGDEMLMFLYSMITPVDATVDTLRVQLLYITVILAAFAFVLAFLISKNISRPISGMVKGVRRLAKSDYSVRFNETGYSEVNELSGALNYATEELSKTEGLRQELIANVSHDLRTPLATIGGYVEMFRDIPSEVTPENTKIVLDEVRRLTLLINDMLDLSKLQSGVQKLNRTRFSFTRLVSETLARFDNAANNGYAIEFDRGEDILVNADRIKLGQVIYNLVGNALTHTDGDKKILVRQEQAADGGVRLSVTDYGGGIAADELQNIWERYYTIDKNHKRSVAGGAGLGLSIVRKILDLHGAQYGAESESGKGSAFWFVLPPDADGPVA